MRERGEIGMELTEIENGEEERKGRAGGGRDSHFKLVAGVVPEARDPELLQTSPADVGLQAP